jgi:hypothetical protein
MTRVYRAHYDHYVRSTGRRAKAAFITTRAQRVGRPERDTR